MNIRSSCPQPLEVSRCGSHPHHKKKSNDKPGNEPQLGILRLKNRQDPERHYQQQYAGNENAHGREHLDVCVVDVLSCFHLPKLDIFRWFLPDDPMDAEENARLEEVSDDGL